MRFDGWMRMQERRVEQADETIYGGRLGGHRGCLGKETATVAAVAASALATPPIQLHLCIAP